ncbi:MAG TPA: hypothetical protein DHV29_04885 [Bacteroidales bacterium]|nr:hypothetical protein [Bacteroidales bacterium]HCB61593.1 hypothetical protein [Bacteroidales bacterium]HCY22805.1 hypothetical protein [Bacteroidales bacterium]
MKSTYLFMSLIILMSAIPAFSQNEAAYEKLWKTTDSLIGKSLPQSAMTEVEKIYAKATAEKNSPQIIKSVIYRITLMSQYQEDYYENSISELKKEIEKAVFPAKPLMYAMLGEMYWNYYTVNRYKFYQRTATDNFDNEDIKTWTLDRLVKEVKWCYDQALKEPEKLAEVKLNSYQAIIDYYDYLQYSPTMLDLIGWMAISRFTNEETALTKPARVFKIDSKDYFFPGRSFAGMKVSAYDTTSFVFYATQVYQTLTRLHEKDKDSEVFTFVELQRLSFMRSKCIMPDRDSLYLNALKELHAASSGKKDQAETGYALAVYYNSLASRYHFETAPQYKWHYNTALEYINEVIRDYPGTRGANNCNVLKETILTPSVTLSFENTSYPGKPFEGILSYSNTAETWFRVIKIDHDKDRDLDHKMSYEEIIEYYSKLTPVKEFSVKLNDPGDHQNHSTNVVFEGLNSGYYIILHSSSADFSLAKGWVGYTSLWSTSISYLMQDYNNQETTFLVADRLSGKPLAGAQIAVFYEKYNYLTREYVYNKYKVLTTDANGKAFLGTLPKGSDYRYMYADVSYNGDRYCPYTTFYMYPPYDYSNDGQTVSYFFTDRSLYRPGQTVYFKGIMLKTDKENNYSILPGTKSTVTFYDANYQVVSQVELTSNDFGTFTGSFTAPDNGITGNMRITNGYGTGYFSVEEYKRPKFYVQFDPVKGSYRLNEKVTVSGKALAYAGNNIDGAKVKYRVVRNARFPYWWGWWQFSMPYSAQVEIANGVATTDENGIFKIDFTALPDESIRKDYLPVFNYTIYADVTDINGETRSGNTWVGAGYKALILGSNISQDVVKGGIKNYEISSENLSGQTVPSEVTMLIYTLKSPDRIISQRLLAQPEYKSLSKDEYLNKFPFGEFADENNPSNWEKGKLIYSHLFNTGKDSLLNIDSVLAGTQGPFMMVLTAKDAFGENVEYQRYFNYYIPSEKKSCSNQAFYVHEVKTTCEPGETASILVGSYGEDTRIMVEVEHKNKIVSAQWYTLNNEQKLLTFPVTEAHRGNFAIHLVCIKGNRFYSGEVNVYVPHTNKQLDIEIESFRDKLQPGEAEKWKIIIKNKKGDKELAELMAGMYDASLDAYKSHSWYLSLLSYYYSYRNWDASSNFTTKSSYQYSLAYTRNYYNQNIYLPKLKWFSFPLYSYGYYSYGYDGYGGDMADNTGVVTMACQTTSTGATREKAANKKDAPAAMDLLVAGEAEMSLEESMDEDGEIPKGGLKVDRDYRNDKGGEANMSDIAVRTNFSETAFFFPQLRTNENGETVIEFTMPESLTKWKFMGLAHTKDLKTGSITKNLVTQKTLMINSFAPRFLREGDKIIFTSKITNLSEADMDGTVMLELIDPLTGLSIAEKFGLTANSMTFSVKKGQSTKVAWELNIPFGIGAVTYRIKAKSGAFTDGEEMSLPILSNRMLVTESLPLPVRGNETKTFTFDKLVNSGNSKTLVSHRYTLEFTSNPAWYAVQALPYIMEYPYECSEQTFSRYYANTIATFIANSYPKIKEVFDTWKNLTPESFLSNLEKNEELKSLVLEETPWVLDAKDESERKKRVGLLFDLNRMAKEQRRTETLLIKLQASNGGFPWYKGMPDDRYITQHIVSGFGKLDHLGIREIKENSRIENMVSKAVYYLDDRIREDLVNIKKYYPKYKTEQHISYIQVHYLYARSYFLNYAVSERNKEAFDYFFAQARTYWTSFSTYGRGMIALALNRYADKTIPADIVKSLKETSLHSDEMGMYWREFAGGYYWWEAPIESQALMVEVFSEVANDATAVEELKIWLLKQKQVQDWKSTKATVDAVYALLIRGFNLLASDKIVEVKIGNEVIDPYKIDNCKVEAGTGYFKTAWTGDQVKPDMGKIQVTKKDSGIAWGAVYWQYFEDLDKITPHETPISIKKQLFVERQSPTGPRMEPIGDNATLKVGDKVKVRIEIRVDREMEYVHMKDMRASCMEPVNVLSTTKYQGGLWYFENTRDAATNFFFNNLLKGTYVFEYSMFTTHAGDFSNGITTIQCMYAPEFSSHSEGIRVKVVE